MSEEDKNAIELDIEAKYVDRLENKYRDKIRGLSLLTLCEIIEKKQNRIQELEKINTEHRKLNGELRQEVKQLKHKIQKIMDYVDNL